MVTLEEIQLRCTRGNRRNVISQLLSGLPPARPQTGLCAVNIYTAADIETDIAVHLHWNIVLPSSGSTTASSIADALRAAGMVNHTVWEIAAGAD